jgi:glycerol-3-phosphate dehydrogenase
MVGGGTRAAIAWGSADGVGVGRGTRPAIGSGAVSEIGRLSVDADCTSSACVGGAAC